MRVLGIDPEEASFTRRGFARSGASQRRLEAVGRTFIAGYRAALTHDDADTIATALARVDEELRGFAYEGAAMGAVLRDSLAPWRTSRFDALALGPGRPHAYMVHVGAGWALARMRRGPGAIRRMDPLLGWLALDGYGFHEGYFKPERSFALRARPRAFRGYAGRAFDQGLGRALWFAEAARPGPVAARIGSFDPRRRADLWSGVALAAAYAGAVGPEALGEIAAAGGRYEDHLAQGAVFAAAARERAGNPAAHTELACRMLAGVTGRQAATLAEGAARDLPPDGAVPAYEEWRSRLRVATRPLARKRAAKERS